MALSQQITMYSQMFLHRPTPTPSGTTDTGRVSQEEQLEKEHSPQPGPSGLQQGAAGGPPQLGTSQDASPG